MAIHSDSLVVVRPSPHGEDVEEFAAVVDNDWLFTCDEVSIFVH